MASFEEYNAVLGMEEWLSLEARYGDAEPSGT
jgi:hypothetical protein